MATLTLGNFEQLPDAAKLSRGVNYAALAADADRFRCKVSRDWATMPIEQRAGLYRFALERVEERPQFFKAVVGFPRIWRAYRAGTLGDFFDYVREIDHLLNKILSLSEDENPVLQLAFLEAVETSLAEPSGEKLHNRQEINDWLRSLV